MTNDWRSFLCYNHKDKIKNLHDLDDQRFRMKGFYNTIDNILAEQITFQERKNQQRPGKIRRNIVSSVASLAKGATSGALLGAGVGYINGDIQAGIIQGAEYGLAIDFVNQFFVVGIYKGIIKPTYKAFKKSHDRRLPEKKGELDSFEDLFHKAKYDDPIVLSQLKIINHIDKYKERAKPMVTIGVMVLSGGLYAASSIPYNVISDDNIPIKTSLCIGAIRGAIDQSLSAIKKRIDDRKQPYHKLNIILDTLDKSERDELIGGLLINWHPAKAYAVKNNLLPEGAVTWSYN